MNLGRRDNAVPRAQTSVVSHRRVKSSHAVRLPILENRNHLFAKNTLCYHSINPFITRFYLDWMPSSSWIFGIYYSKELRWVHNPIRVERDCSPLLEWWFWAHQVQHLFLSKHWHQYRQRVQLQSSSKSNTGFRLVRPRWWQYVGRFGRPCGRHPQDHRTMQRS